MLPLPLVLLAILWITPTPAAGQMINPNPRINPCPVPSEEAETDTRRLIEAVLEGPRFAEGRQEIGLDAISIDQVQLLTNENDRVVCRQFNSYPDASTLPYEPFYYKAGDFYFIAPYGETSTAYSPIFVFHGGGAVEDLKSVFPI